MEPNIQSGVIASVRVANGLTSSTLRHSVLTSSAVTNPAEEEDVPLSGAKPKGCARLFAVVDKYPTSFVLGGAFIGVCLGIGLAQWVPTSPEDELSKSIALQWIGLIGDLFLRAIKCIVLPMVFVSVAISIMDMLSLGETGTIVGTTREFWEEVLPCFLFRRVMFVPLELLMSQSFALVKTAFHVLQLDCTFSRLY